MVSRTGQEIRLKQYPKGMPTEDIFKLAKVDVPEPTYCLMINNAIASL